MSRTVWAIVIIGFLTAIFLVVAMFFMLKQFSQSPYSSATKLSQTIKGEFRFEGVGTATQMTPTVDGPKNVLLVQYDTHADSKFDLDVQNREMDRVGKFAVENTDRSDRPRFVEIRVRRTEIHGRGCFQQSYVSDRVVPNPFYVPPNAPLPPRQP